MRLLYILIILFIVCGIYYCIYRVRILLDKKNHKQKRIKLFDYYNLYYFMLVLLMVCMGYIIFASATLKEHSGEEYQQAYINKDGELVRGK